MKRFKQLLLVLILGLGLVSIIGLIPTSDVAAQSCVPPPNGLISWWSGDQTANDIVGSNDGTLQNGATFAPGKVGQAFSLDGVDDFVLVPNLDVGSLTFDAWVKRDRVSVPGWFDRLLVSVDNNGWGVMLASDNTVELSLVGISDVGSVGTISDTGWHHIAVTHDGSNACFYIDGNLDSCQAYSVTFNSSGGNYTIGSRGASEFFDGLIDEVEVFNRALTATEIQSIFNAGSAGKCKGPPFPPYNIEPFDTDCSGNCARRNSGGFFDDPENSFFDLVYWVGTNGGPASLTLFFSEQFGDWPGNDFAIVTGSEAWGTLAGTARFDFFLEGILQGSFEAELGPGQMFIFDLPGEHTVANRVVVTNITPDPPGINDLATMEFLFAGVVEVKKTYLPIILKNQ